LTPPAQTWQYVYGIVRSDDPLLFEVGGVDGADEVYTVGEGGLMAVVSDIARPSLAGQDRAEVIQHLTAHQRVLETVQQDLPVLPARFGTILPDRERVLSLLRRGGAVIGPALDAYAGKQQFEVVALWDLQQVFQQIGADEQIVALKAQIAARGPESGADDRVLVGRLVHAALQQRRALLSQEIAAQLRGPADDVIVNPLMSDAMVANIALLVDDGRRHELDARLDELDAQYGGRLQIRCVGPLPAYSFATLEAQAPSPEAVDAARRELGLPEATSLAGLKSAFRALAAKHHPDHNPGDEGAAARMDALTGAYRLLAGVAQAQAPAASAGDWPCDFGRAAVEATVLVSVARQEA
jgi:hypothetical protein